MSERNINSFTESLRSYKSSDLYNYGPRETALKLAQMRMKCSKLNAHLLALHVIESAECSCGHDCEDTNHYLFHCPLYITERDTLLAKLQHLNLNSISEEILTKGDRSMSTSNNKFLFDCVFEFINNTDRL